MSATPSAKSAPKKENFLINIAFNLVIPALILGDWGKTGFEKLIAMTGGDPAAMPHLAETRLIIAVSFPAVYFIVDYIRRRQANVISIFGFVGTLLSGVVGLMKLDPMWFAVKEAVFPAIIAGGLYLSALAGKPLVKAFVWNDTVMNTEKILDAAVANGRRADIDRLFRRVTFILTPIFIYSAAANFALARWLVTSHPEVAQDAFNAELAKFNWMSWPFIMLPSMGYLIWVMFKFVKQLATVSGLPEEEIYRS